MIGLFSPYLALQKNRFFRQVAMRVDSAARSTYTFNSIDVGRSYTRRGFIVVALAHLNVQGQTSEVLVNGNAASIIAPTGTERKPTISHLNLDGGNLVDISISYASTFGAPQNQNFCAIALYEVSDFDLSIPHYAGIRNTGGTSTSRALSSLAVPPNGFAISGMYKNNQSPVTWDPPVTPDGFIGAPGLDVSQADFAFYSNLKGDSIEGVTFATSWSGSTSGGMIGASFG